MGGSTPTQSSTSAGSASASAQGSTSGETEGENSATDGSTAASSDGGTAETVAAATSTSWVVTARDTLPQIIHKNPGLQGFRTTTHPHSILLK